MDPAPAFSARGHRGGWVYRRKLYYEACDELTRWARREFQVGVARVPWEEASDLHRSSLLAWQADFTEESIGTCGTSTPTSTTPSSPEAATNQSQFTNGHRPQLKARQGRPHQLSHSNRQAPHQAHPPPQAQRRHRQQQGREIRLQLQAQRFHLRTTTESSCRPSSYPPATANRGRYTAAGRSLLRRKRTPPARRQPSLAPVRKASTRRSRSRTPLRAAASSAAGSRTRSSSSSTPPARACAGQLRLPDNPGGQRRDLDPPAPIRGCRTTRRATHPVPSDDPYDLPDSYWHHPPRAESSSDPSRKVGTSRLLRSCGLQPGQGVRG